MVGRRAPAHRDRVGMLEQEQMVALVENE